VGWGGGHIKMKRIIKKRKYRVKNVAKYREKIKQKTTDRRANE
jgi:hypothetical protein